MNKTRIITLTAVTTLALAACGSDSKTHVVVPTTVRTATSEPSTTAAKPTTTTAKPTTTTPKEPTTTTKP